MKRHRKEFFKNKEKGRRLSYKMTGKERRKISEFKLSRISEIVWYNLFLIHK